MFSSGPPAPKVLGSDIKTYFKSRLCYAGKQLAKGGCVITRPCPPARAKMLNTLARIKCHFACKPFCRFGAILQKRGSGVIVCARQAPRAAARRPCLSTKAVPCTSNHTVHGHSAKHCMGIQPSIAWVFSHALHGYSAKHCMGIQPCIASG